ncbi:hypothetical protein [Ornithinimicrobium kibberense]|uniref:hypothetical protein n=1 Tax=Ornithinimicrobium kibberense TaxID=282060 RepID=UPI0036152971
MPSRRPPRARRGGPGSGRSSPLPASFVGSFRVWSPPKQVGRRDRAHKVSSGYPRISGNSCRQASGRPAPSLGAAVLHTPRSSTRGVPGGRGGTRSDHSRGRCAACPTPSRYARSRSTPSATPASSPGCSTTACSRPTGCWPSSARPRATAG